MTLRTSVRAAVAAASLLAAVPASAQDTGAAELNLTASRPMGGAAAVRGSIRLTNRDATTPASPLFTTPGDTLSFTVTAGRTILPTDCRPSGHLQLRSLPPGTASLVHRGGARTDAVAVEVIANAGEVLVGATGLDGERLFEGVAVPVSISGPEEDIVWTPFTTTATLANGSRTAVEGEVTVVRNSDGSGRVLARYASGGPFTIVATIDVTYQDAASQQRTADDTGTSGTIEIAPRSARLLFNLPPADADAALDAVHALPDGANATVAFGDVDGDDVSDLVAIGAPTVRDRSQRVVLREDRRDPAAARAVIRVSDTDQIPSDLVVSVSDPYRDDGFTSTSVPVSAMLFGVVVGTNTTKEEPAEALDALLSMPDADGTGATAGFSRAGTDEVLDEDRCALDPERARCVTPSGALIHLRANATSVVTSVQWPYVLSTPTNDARAEAAHMASLQSFRVGAVSVTDASGRPFLSETPDRVSYRGVASVPDMPIIESDDLERRVLIELYDEDGQLSGSTGMSFLPAAGFYPLLPEPLGPIRFDPGCAWWDLLCEWGF